MNFSCDNCQRRYSIADEKVSGKTVKIRCKNCQTIITVTGPEPEPEIPEEDRTRMVPLSTIENLRASSLAPVAAAPPARDPWEDEPTRTAPPVDTSAQWFAMVKGKQEGPLDASALARRFSAGELSPRTYMWKQGMADWKRAADMPELASVLAGAQPPPAPHPVAGPAPRAARARQEPVPELDEEERTQGVAGMQEEEFSEPAHSPERHWEPPEPREAPASNPADLFSDLDLDRGAHDRGAEETTEDLPASGPGMASSRDGAQDPFAALGEGAIKPPPAAESTGYIIAKSGVKNRNPPWKIGLFVTLLIGLPVGLLYMLSELKVVPLQVTRVNAQGQQVQESVFSAEGVAGLRDLLMGTKPQPAVAPAPLEPPKPRQPSQARTATEPAKPTPSASNDELKKLYGDNGGKVDVGPHVRKQETPTHAAAAAGADGPPEQEVAKVVDQNQKAFQSCIEAEMKKNPGFKGGKIKLTATIGGSGTVKKAVIDRHDVDSSSLGECLKGRAKRMIFSHFDADEADVEIPLILTTAM